MYDGILVALKMLVAAKAKQPECKPLLIVLTDGETNAGLSFDKVKPVLGRRQNSHLYDWLQRQAGHLAANLRHQ